MSTWANSIEALWGSLLPIIVVSLFSTYIGVSSTLLDHSKSYRSQFTGFIKSVAVIILLLGLFIPQPIVHSTLNLLARDYFGATATQTASFYYVQMLPYITGLSYLLASTILGSNSLALGSKLFMRNSRNNPLWSDVVISSLPIRFTFFFVWGVCIIVMMLEGPILGQEGWTGMGVYLIDTLEVHKTGEPLWILLFTIVISLCLFMLMHFLTFLQVIIARHLAVNAIRRTSVRRRSTYKIVRKLIIVSVSLTVVLFAIGYIIVFLRLTGNLGSPFESSPPKFNIGDIGSIITSPDLGVTGALIGSLSMIVMWTLSSLKYFKGHIRNPEKFYLILGLIVFIPSEFVGAFILSSYSGNYDIIFFLWGLFSGLSITAILLSDISAPSKWQRYLNLKYSTGSINTLRVFVKEYRTFIFVVVSIALLHNGFDGGIRAKFGMSNNTIPGAFQDTTGGGFSETQRGLALEVIFILSILLVLLRIPPVRIRTVVKRKGLS